MFQSIKMMNKWLLNVINFQEIFGSELHNFDEILNVFQELSAESNRVEFLIDAGDPNVG